MLKFSRAAPNGGLAWMSAADGTGLTAGTVNRNNKVDLGALCFCCRQTLVLSAWAFVLRELFSLQSASFQRGRKWKTLWQVISPCNSALSLINEEERESSNVLKSGAGIGNLALMAPSRNYFFLCLAIAPMWLLFIWTHLLWRTYFPCSWSETKAETRSIIGGLSTNSLPCFPQSLPLVPQVVYFSIYCGKKGLTKFTIFTISNYPIQ